MNEQYFSDFYKVPDITFDIEKLRAEVDRILKQKNLYIRNYKFCCYSNK